MKTDWQLFGVDIPDWLGEWLAEIAEIERTTVIALLSIGVLAGLLIALAAVVVGVHHAYT